MTTTLQEQFDELKIGTEALTSQVGGLSNALVVVNQIRERQIILEEEALVTKQTADATAAVVVPRDEIERKVRESKRRTRRIAALAAFTLGALVVSVVLAILAFRSASDDRARNLQQRRDGLQTSYDNCQLRNTSNREMNDLVKQISNDATNPVIVKDLQSYLATHNGQINCQTYLTQKAAVH